MEAFAFLKDATKMRVIHCAWISVVTLLLLFLLASSNLNKNLPAEVYAHRKPPDDVHQLVASRASSSDAEADQGIQRQGRTDASLNRNELHSSRVDYRAWDSSGGCKVYRKKHPLAIRPSPGLSSLQRPGADCLKLRKQHVSVLVKSWTWIPDTLNNLYSCGCGLTCLWTNTGVLADRPDAHLYETNSPPLTSSLPSYKADMGFPILPRKNRKLVYTYTESSARLVVSRLGDWLWMKEYELQFRSQDDAEHTWAKMRFAILASMGARSWKATHHRWTGIGGVSGPCWVNMPKRKGEPWRVFMDLEPGRNRAESQDLFVSYHADDDVQVTYAGASFHVIRNYYVSPVKLDDVLVYWSSSRCVDERQKIASEVLALLPHHSFGKCLNNVGGGDMILSMYPKCAAGSGAGSVWAQNLHCAMSHYKFVLAIENTRTESYVTEKLFYALDVGAVPIYFGAPNVLDFVPPHSIIEGDKFASVQELAEYVKKVVGDPTLYAEYHAWRRCGVMGNYGRARAVSLDSLPCRLCAAVSQLGGRDA